MSWGYCQLCKTPWANHSAACTMRPDPADAALAAKDAEIAKLRKELAEARGLIARLAQAPINCEAEDAARAFLARKEAP